MATGAGEGSEWMVEEQRRERTLGEAETATIVAARAWKDRR